MPTTTIELRDYQDTGVSRIKDAFSRKIRRVLYVLPTGGGKTITFVYIARNAAARGKRICILVHRSELLDQTSRALDAMGVDHGIISAGRTPSSAMVQVASVQTLARRLHLYPHFDLLIIDEAHHGVAGSWRKVAEAYPKAFILGVTATPERLDGRGLGDAFDELVLGPTVRELMDLGHLSPATVYAPATEVDLSAIRTTLGDFEHGALNKVMSDSVITGNAVEHYRRLCAGVPAVAFCVSVEHSRQVAAQFRAAGLRAAHVDGTTDPGERRGMIGGLGSGSLDVLTSCEIISEGVDIPVIGAAILLRPTQSLGLMLQQVGRSLRPYPDKQRAIILDHAGNVRRHGLPDDPREWSLEGRKRKKRSAEDAGPPVRQCPECFAFSSAMARACDACGEPFAVSVRSGPEEVAGELVEVTRDPMIEALPYAAFRDVMAWAGSDEVRLKMVAKARGYHHGWIRRQLDAMRLRPARAA